MEKRCAGSCTGYTVTCDADGALAGDDDDDDDADDDDADAFAAIIDSRQHFSVHRRGEASGSGFRVLGLGFRV